MKDKGASPGKRSKPRPLRFWDMADYFREEAGPKWKGSRIEFGNASVVTGGGHKWRVSLVVSAWGHGRVMAGTTINIDPVYRPSDGKSRFCPELFAFTRATERKLARLGYTGGFTADHRGASFYGTFGRTLASLDDVAAERARLESLRLGSRPESRPARRPGKRRTHS